MIGAIINGFGKVTPIAKAIPIIKLACKAEIKEIADIFPRAIAEREIGEVNALFIKPYRLSHNVLTPPKIQVIDSPENMKKAMGNEVISIILEEEKNYNSFLSDLKKIEFVNKINDDGSKLTLFASNGTEVIPKIFQISSELDIKIISISLTQPTLDDVFISYTGHEIRDDDSGFNRKREHAKMKRLRA